MYRGPLLASHAISTQHPSSVIYNVLKHLIEWAIRPAPPARAWRELRRRGCRTGHRI